MKLIIDLENVTKIEPPKESGEYLCYIAESDEWIVLPYSARLDLFNAYDYWPERKALKEHINVDYWLPLPEIKGL